MSGAQVHHPTSPTPTSAKLVRKAWWSLGLLVPSFVAAMVVGEGIPAWWGYSEPSLDDTPWSVIAVAVLSALIVFVLPLLVVVHFGRGAIAAGDDRGRAPILVGVAVACGFIALNLAGGLVQIVAG